MTCFVFEANFADGRDLIGNRFVRMRLFTLLIMRIPERD